VRSSAQIRWLFDRVETSKAEATCCDSARLAGFVAERPRAVRQP